MQAEPCGYYVCRSKYNSIHTIYVISVTHAMCIIVVFIIAIILYADICVYVPSGTVQTGDDVGGIVGFVMVILVTLGVITGAVVMTIVGTVIYQRM